MHLGRRRALSTFLALLMFAGVSCEQLRNLPTLSEEDLELKLAESSLVFDGDGNLMTTLHGEENRTLISDLEQIPEHVREAVVAIEDARFYEHEGVDLRAIIRAAVANVTAGEIKEGGSTITQQYVKNVIIAPGGTAEKTYERKLHEAALARQLEKELGKNEILLRYLNTVYFGNGAYGLQAAAKTYFGKTVGRLKMHEGALLAGVIRAPSLYDPLEDKKAATDRRNLVIERMAQQDFITTEEAEAAQAGKLRLHPSLARARYPAPYFLDYVQRLIKYDPYDWFEKVGKSPAQRERAMFQGGLRVHTTVDLEQQRAAENAVEKVLSFKDDPHAALVAIEPSTGYVKAMVGGRDWFAPPKEDEYAKLNLAIQAEPGLGCVHVPGEARCERRAPGSGRQAGSAFKPFALAAGLEEGISLAQGFKADACMDFKGADAGGDWHVCNYAESGFGKSFSLLEATVFSVNVVYAQLILKVGAEDVVELAEDMGIKTPLSPVPSAVLGSNEVNPLGMASAYATLANYGKYNAPVAITKITDAGGKVLYEVAEEPEEDLGEGKVLDKGAAYLATTALEQVIERGTAAASGNIQRPAAGKTGTAQEYRDAWFAGYTPDLAAVVWVGYPEGQIEMKPSCGAAACRPTRIQVTGGSWPTEIWAYFMLSALSAFPATDFEVPDLDLVKVTIDTREDNCLAGEFTPEEFKQTIEVLKGTQPKEECRISSKPQRVPDVFGFPVDDAIRVLEGAGFEVEIEKTPTSTYPPGRVIGQDPAGGEEAVGGSTVVIQVSEKGDDSDSGTVPNVLGMKQKEAEDALHDAGFNVQIITQAESDEDDAKRNKDRVWKQSPPSGSEAEKGSTVTIWVNPR